jgi:ribosome-binding protein aMBF1 (putative translation factor)
MRSGGPAWASWSASQDRTLRPERCLPQVTNECQSPWWISEDVMTRSYEEASAERRGQLSAEAKPDGAVFEDAYRLAVQVVERRERLELTRTELAAKSGIDQGDISRIERGSIYPNEKTLIRLADALGAEWPMVDEVAP